MIKSNKIYNPKDYLRYIGISVDEDKPMSDIPLSYIQRVLKEALNLTQENQEVHSYTNYKDSTELALDEVKNAIKEMVNRGEYSSNLWQ